MTATPIEDWFLLVDPSWTPATADAVPPVEVVVGLWPLEEEGRLGQFRTNPDYLPLGPDSPSDPLDAVLRLVLAERVGAEHIQLMLRDTFFDIATYDDARPLLTLSPDGVRCVVVATGEVHRQRVNAPAWRRIDLDDLVVLLADEVDVLFNPSAPASIRLSGDFIRETLLLDDDQATELLRG
ncbi:type VII secretion system-associated protein [Kribbella sp. NPDC051587]|uniref:type VII secretion system-associated protein n=1 Tax=Kribbella sp. NPDC051587 TaxID=3364119 RepID=UPI0037A13806